MNSINSASLQFGAFAKTSPAMSLLGSWTVEVVTSFAVLIAVVYYYYGCAYTYWKKKNVPQIRPKIPFAETFRTFTGKTSFSAVMNERYDLFKDHGFGGAYNFMRPTLVVCDPELIKQILTKDFASFHDHGLSADPEIDPLNANLFNLAGQRWKTLRAKLSPTFTSGRIKGMFPLIQECVEQLQDCIRDESKNNNGSVDMNNLLRRYCSDVIGTCAFGVNFNCLKNPDAEFQHLGREMLKMSFRNLIQFIVITVCPKLSKYVTTRRIHPKSSAFFTGLIKDTVKYRRENNVERNDFVQLMMQIQDEETEDKFFSLDIMTAQATIFFVAGLDNIANPIGFCLHAMAVAPALQDKVYEEITRVLEESGGIMTYEAVKKMDLVSRVFDEGLRMHTPTAFLFRELTSEKYILPGTDVVLEKGTLVMIPLQAIHHDEKYFPDPKKFNPDRFTEDEKSRRHPFSYLPFGEGPRFCIASRFAKLEMRLCFAKLVQQFQFGVAPETDLSLELDKINFGPTPKNGFWLKVTERA